MTSEEEFILRINPVSCTTCRGFGVGKPHLFSGLDIGARKRRVLEEEGLVYCNCPAGKYLAAEDSEIVQRLWEQHSHSI